MECMIEILQEYFERIVGKVKIEEMKLASGDENLRWVLGTLHLLYSTSRLLFSLMKQIPQQLHVNSQK